MEWYEKKNVKDFKKITIEKDIQYYVDNIANEYDYELDLYVLMCVEYFAIWEALRTKKAHKFYLGGGRGSGKSYAIAYFILFDIFVGRYTNWYVFMWEKVDNSQRTMLLMEKILNMYIGKFWPEIRIIYKKKDSPVEKELMFKIGKSTQIIKFAGAKDIDKGTIEPPQSDLAYATGINTYWSGFWFEEVSGSDEKGGVNNEKVEEMKNKIDRLRGSLLRFLPKDKNGDPYPLIEFYSFNPYSDENAITANWVEHHDKILEETEWEGHIGKNKFDELIETGYTHTINEELKEMYISTNRILSYRYGVLNQGLDDLEYIPMFKNNKTSFYVEALGRAGVSQRSVYSSIWDFVRRYQNEIILEDKFNAFKIGIDIGYGGEGETAMVLGGRYYDEEDHMFKWVILEELTLNYKDERKYDRLNLIRELVFKISKWEKKYLYMTLQKEIDIVSDEDYFFIREFAEKFTQTIAHEVEIRCIYKFHAFKEKHFKKYINALRPQFIEPLLTHGLLRIYSKRTEKVYNQFRSLKYTEDKWVNYNSKRIKDVELGNDDARQAVEMLIYHEIPFLTKQLVDKGIEIKFLQKFIS